jgi:5-methylcytosine-specific restriction endonuclease McrA
MAKAKKPKKKLDLKSFLIAKLRNVSQKWPSIYGAKIAAKVYVTVTATALPSVWHVQPDGEREAFLVDDEKLKSGRRVMFQCAYCKLLWFDKRWEKAQTGRWVKRSGVDVDHVHPVVAVDHDGWSWDDYIKGMFEGEMQVLCKACHMCKSAIEQGERADARRERKARSLEVEEN